MQVNLGNRSWVLLLAIMLATAGTGMASTSWRQYTLTRSDVCRIESDVEELPGGSRFDDYDRVYAGQMENDRYVVTGVLTRSRNPATPIGSHEKLPLVFDGGCDVITIKYDLQSKTVLSVRCNGEA